MDSILVSKIILALCYPLGLAFVLVVMRWVFRSFGWRSFGGLLGFLAVLIVVLGSNPLAARWLAASLENQYPQQAMQDIAKHDAILVLGGGLRLPQQPAKFVQIGGGSDRLLYALRLYRAGKASEIVLSGGNVFPQAGLQGESFYAAKLLQTWGVPKDVIVIETGSRNTSENRSLTEDFFRKSDISTVLLVTSALHMPRAYKVFRTLPVSITPASADVLIRQSTNPEVFNWIPSAGALQLTTVALHEYYGMWFSELKAKIFSG